jgi:DNA uptake protein ComE-like DNA-binding protein
MIPGVLLGQITAEEEVWLEQWVEADEELLPQQMDRADLPLSSILLNSITKEQLQALSILSEEQIQSFLDYRAEFGPFLVVEELRAVPLFDPSPSKKCNLIWCWIHPLKSPLLYGILLLWG